MTVRIVIPAGVELYTAMRGLVWKARKKGNVVVANIKDIDVFADPDSSAADLMRYYITVKKMIVYMEDNGLDVSRFLTDEPFK